MGLKLHGFVVSTAMFSALVALYEKDLDFELVPVDFAAGEHKTPAFLARNPFGQVPAFEDGDLELFESRAITRYVAEKYADKGTNLIYKDPKKLAIQRVWMEVEGQKFHPPALKLTYELFGKPFLGQTIDEAVVEEFEKKLEGVLDVYEKRLTESRYLGGDCFTLADLHHLPNLYFLMGTKVKRVFDARPHVSAWASEILSRPASVKVASIVQECMSEGR